MKCPTCKGNGRIEALEHCPTCKVDGKCDGEVRCVCGCTEDEHDRFHELVRPESRSVTSWSACEVHNCVEFRPVLPWPDSEGWWWEDSPYIGDAMCFACKLSDGSYNVTYYGEVYGAAYWLEHYGPTRFVKLREPNPFT